MNIKGNVNRESNKKHSLASILTYGCLSMDHSWSRQKIQSMMS